MRCGKRNGSVPLQRALATGGAESREEQSPLALSVDNVKAGVSGGESLNGGAEPGGDLLEIDVFDGRKSVGAKNRSNASRIETSGRTFTHFLQLFGPLLF